MKYELNLDTKVNDNRYKKVIYEIDDNDCWNCVSHSKDRDGYPKFSRKYKGVNYQRIHRLSYQFAYNDLKQLDLVRHMCNNRSCINPKHLIKGTPLDNMRDRYKSGMYNVALNYDNKTTKLNIKEVLEINELLNENELRVADIARLYNVNWSTIDNIKTGNSWNQVTNRKTN